MAITGELSVVLNGVVKKYWKHYTDAEIADAINKQVKLKGKNRISASTITQRRGTLGFLREKHLVIKSKRPPIVIDVELFKKAKVGDVNRESDKMIIKRFLDEIKNGEAQYVTQRDLVLAIMKEIPRFTAPRALQARIVDLGLKLPVFRGAIKVTEKKEERPIHSLGEVMGLKSYVLTRIDANALVQNKGIESLFRDVIQHFGDVLQKSNLVLSSEQFVEFVRGLVWTRSVQDSLTDYLRHAADPDQAIRRWHKSYAYIPLEWINEQSKWVRGISSVVAPVAMIPGLGGYLQKGWLDGVPDVEVPDTSFAKPFKVTLPPESKCRFLVLNGANLGLVYNKAIEENPLRRKLAEAEIYGVDAVFLTNVFGLEIGKAGGALMVYRARLSGLNTNIDLLPSDYRAEAERIIKVQPDDEVVFEAPMERVINLLTGLHKITTKPDGKNPDGTPKFKPEFSGKMYLILGWKEEHLFNTLAYWVLNYLRILKQAELKGDMNLAKQDMVTAKKANDLVAYDAASREHQRLLQQHARSITSSITAQDANRFAPKIRSIILARLKELVPNIEIIGQGTSYVQLNDKPVVTFHIPGHIRVTDTLLADYAATCGPKIIRKEMAKLTIICHPHALQARDTVREADHDGQRDSVQVFVAPILIDGDFLRAEFGDIVRSTHPIQRAIFHDQFKAGALCFDYHAPENIVSQDFWPITRTHKASNIRRKDPLVQPSPYPDFKDAPYIWYALATDPHLGGRSRQMVWCEDLKSHLGLFEASLHSMRVSKYLGSKKFGIHMWSCNDDPTQAHNYPTEQQPHPQQIPNVTLEEITREYEAKMRRSRGNHLAIFEEYQKLIHGQINNRGLDWVQLQMEDLFDRFITPNMDFFSGVLLRAKESGLRVKPVSEHYGVPYDMRDLGIINWGSGNHFDHSVEGMLTEGFLYARDMRNKMLLREEWRDQQEYVDRHVVAPLYSNFFCAWGTIRVGKGYEWGMDLRPSPTRMGSWGDTLLGAMRNDVLRGNPTKIMEGRVRIQTYGDKHFFGTAITPDVIFHMCASNTQTDRYGEHGFPPNNSGVSFIGIPVEGPRVPVLFRYLRYDQLVHLVQSGVTFDWEAFLPNPA